MIDEMEENHAGVVCLYCGMHTPLPILMNRRSLTGTFPDSNRRVSIVRCCVCGKEAPYLARDVIVLGEASDTVSVIV
jgi:hypothetical protein